MIPGISRRVVVWFGLGLAVLAVNAVVAYHTIDSLRQATRSVAEGLQVAELLRGVSAAVADSEAGQRGYIISEKQEYLEHSSEVLRVADRRLSEIRALVGHDTVELEKIVSLQSSIAARTGEDLHTLADKRYGDCGDAVGELSADL